MEILKVSYETNHIKGLMGSNIYVSKDDDYISDWDQYSF